MSVLSLFVCAVLVSQAAAYCSQTAYSAAGPFNFPVGDNQQLDLHLPQWNGYLGPNAVWGFSFDVNHALVPGDSNKHIVLSQNEFFSSCPSSSLTIEITLDASGSDVVLCLNNRCGTLAIVAGTYVSCNVTVDHTDVHLCVANACDLVTADFTAADQQYYDQNFQIGGAGTSICNPLGGSLKNIRLCHDCQSVSGCSGVVIGACTATTTQLCTPNLCQPTSCITGNSSCVQGFGQPSCRCNNANAFYGYPGELDLTSTSSEDVCTFIPAPNALTTANCSTSLNGFWSVTPDPYSPDSYPELYLLGGPGLRDDDTETGIATKSDYNNEFGYVGWGCYKKPTSVNVSCMAVDPNSWGCQFTEGTQVSYLDPVTGSFVHAFNIIGIQDQVYSWKVFDLTPYPPSTTWQFQSSDDEGYLAIGEMSFAGGNACQGFGNALANCAAAQGGAVCACNNLNCAFYCNNGAWTQYNIQLPPATQYNGNGGGGSSPSSSSSTTQGGGGGATHSSSSSSTGNGGGGVVTHSSSSSSTGNGGGGVVTHSSSSSTGSNGGGGGGGDSSSTGDNGGGDQSGDASSLAAGSVVVALVLAVVSWL